MAPHLRRPAEPEVEVADEKRTNLTTYILALTAISRKVTVLCLVPVYGSFSLESPYSSSLDFSMLLGSFAIIALTHKAVNPDWLILAISLLGCASPSITSYFYSFSNYLGPHWGPLVPSLFTNLALTSTALYFAAYSDWRQPKYAIFKGFGKFSFAIMLGIAYAFLVLFEQIIHVVLYSSAGTAILSSIGRYGLQTGLSCGFAFLGRSRKSLIILPVLLLAAYNSHIPFSSNIARLNANLEVEGYQLIDRRESVTGYVSVLENLKDGFRVLRCDHSLLGGEWTRYPGGYVPKLKEPIYAIFVMLEAVRLVQTEPLKNIELKLPEKQQALFIGLGIGTSPAAFIHHGIAVTIVEIDPVVHDFATKYFDLPPNHTPIINDAITFVNEGRSTSRGQYDFIIHDVFTGGAEPIQLFTENFLEGLRALLHEDGTIAINYAGDLLLPTAAAVVKTALVVFPICRLFRETAAPSDSMQMEDLTNMVIFCRKTQESFSFRDPIEADFLGSHARQEFLLPQHEVPINHFDLNSTDVITEETMGYLKASQKQSALSHWYLMRRVIPSAVWENW